MFGNGSYERLLNIQSITLLCYDYLVTPPKFFKTSRRSVLIVICAELDFCHETTTTHFYPPPFSRDELLIFILYFDSPFFCFQQVDLKVERLQTKSSMCLLLCGELTFFHFLLLKADMSTERTLSD